MRGRGSSGFTLVEQMVVMLVLALLAAIALPAIIRQREKGWVAQVQSSLKDASTLSFAFGNDHGGNFDELDDVADIEEQGFRPTQNVAITVEGSETGYCVRALHLDLSADHEWKLASYDSTEQAPSPADDCP